MLKSYLVHSYVWDEEEKWEDSQQFADGGADADIYSPTPITKKALSDPHILYVHAHQTRTQTHSSAAETYSLWVGKDYADFAPFEDELSEKCRGSGREGEDFDQTETDGIDA